MKRGAEIKPPIVEESKDPRRGVTELKQAKDERGRVPAALRESEKNYKTLVEQSLQGLVIAQGVLPSLVFANSVMADILGYSTEELLSLSPEEIRALVHPDDQAVFLGRYQARLAGKPTPPRYEVRAVRKDGAVRWVEIFSSRIEYRGKPAVQAVFLDVTERKRTEGALRGSEERYRTLTDNVNVGVYRNSTGPQGKFIEANRAIIKMFGFQNREEFLAVKVAELYQNPEDRRKFNDKMLRDGFVKNEELRLKRKDGTPFIGSVSAVAVRDEKGEVRYYDGVIEDITERKKAERALREKTHQQEQLLDTARYLTESLDVKEVLTRIGIGAQGIVRARSCTIYLLEADGKTLSPVVSLDPNYAEEILTTPLDVETSFTGQAVKTRKGMIFNDAVANPAGHQIPGTPVEKDERIIVAPFVVDHKVLGAMCLDRIGTPFSEEDLALAQTFATYAATALKNAQTYHDLQHEVEERERAQEELKQSVERLQRLLGETVNVLASTIEMRDPYTAGHQRRVAVLACAIAEEMGLSQERIDGIRLAAIIHDIGKIQVPAEILSKPGRLTETEFNLIKAHPQVGHDVLKTIEFPWPVAQIILQHHERMDGSGFPQGLSGEKILLEARILAVADVVEAMSSHRPYRPAQGKTETLEEISQKRGLLYDPQVVDACLRLFEEKGFKFE